MLLARAKDRPPLQQRLAGALLGALNGVLIVAFLLRFAVTSQPSFAAMIESLPLAKILFDGLYAPDDFGKLLNHIVERVGEHTERVGRHFGLDAQVAVTYGADFLEEFLNH